MINSPDSVVIEAIAADKLENMGLGELQGNQATNSGQLYCLYFQEQLW